MTRHNLRSKCLWLWLLLLALPGLAAGGCVNRGPFSPEAQAQAEARADYVRLLALYTVKDDTFEWDRLGSALVVTALYFSPEISKASWSRWNQDPFFSAETAGWWHASKKASGTPTIVLMGIYTPDFRADDLLKTGRFRLSLKTVDGRIIKPVRVKRYGRQNKFISDYFPAFNPWEEVYLAEFAPLTSSAGGQNSPEFILDWPGGSQGLPLPMPGGLE